MKLKYSIILLLVICLIGCSNKKQISNVSVTTNNQINKNKDIDKNTIEEQKTNTESGMDVPKESFIEEEQEESNLQDKIKGSSQIQIKNFLQDGTFWGVETDNAGEAYIIHADVYGNVMNRAIYSDAEKEMRYGIGNNLVIWEGEYPLCIYDLNTNENVTTNFVGDYDEIYDLLETEDGFVFVVKKTIDTFEENFDCVKLVDTEGNILIEISLDKNTLLTKYGIEKNPQNELKVKWVGKKVFYIPYIGDEYAGREFDSLIIDLARNKVIPVNAPSNNMTGYCSSDGNHTLIYESYKGSVIVDNETGAFSVMGNEYVPAVAFWLGREAEVLSEDKYMAINRFSGLFYVLDIQGDEIIDLNNYGQNVVKMYPFTDKAALIEFENGYVTFINSNGEFLFEPIQGTVVNFFSNLCAVVIVNYDNGELFLLDREGNKQVLNILHFRNVFYAEYEGRSYLIEGEGRGLNVIEIE